jgi:O-acetyl-ADP-ribose deacetylase (regulator of RNase III)
MTKRGIKMELIEIEGDLFKNTFQGDTIAHGVNCLGLMGAGVAVPIKNMFPNNYLTYKEMCFQRVLTPGSILPVVDNGVTVVNMATQFQVGANATYEYIDESASNLYSFAHRNNVPVVKLPKIGCGIGGLKWEVVSKLLKEQGGDDVTLEVYYL